MLELKTERLVLRAPVPEDAEALAPMYADPEVMRYVGDGRTLTKAETELSVRRMIERWEVDGFGLFTTLRAGGRGDHRARRDPDLEQRHVGADHAGAAVRADGGRGRLHARPRFLGAGLRDRGGRRGPRLRAQRARRRAGDRADHPREHAPPRTWRASSGSSTSATSGSGGATRSSSPWTLRVAPVSESRDLLSRTAEIAADYLESLGERPVFPRTTPEELREALGGPLPEEPLDADEVVAELADGGRARCRRDRERPLLRLRDRRRPSRGPRGRLAHLGLGPERRPLRRRPVGVGGRAGDAGMARRAARPARRVVGRLRHRHADGARDRARGRALPRARRGRLGRRTATASPARRRSACSSARSATSPSTGRCGCSASARRPPLPPTTRAGWRSPRSARGARRRAGDRLRPGRRGEHRRLRPAPGDRGCLRGGRRLAARGRRLRHLGGGLAAASPPRRRPRAGRLVDDRRAQVAERPLRLGHRPLRPSRVASRGDDDLCVVPDPGRGSPARARPGRLGAGVLAPRPRLRRLRGAALARPQRARRARRALLRRRAPLRRGDRRARRRRGPERGRAQPGALPLRVGRAHRRGAAARAGERRDLAERHDLERAQGDPRLGLELADRRRGDRPRGRGLPRQRSAPARRRRGRPGPRASGRRSPPARSRSRRARRGRRRSRLPRARAGRRDPRSRCCRSRAARRAAAEPADRCVSTSAPASSAASAFA